MGTAAPKLVKRRAEELIERFPEKLSADFENNKELINKLKMPFSKTIRNLITGYATRKMKEKAAKS